jgi:hypothetical protein
VRLLAAAVFIVSALPAGAADYPKIELSTKKLKLTCYPPDAEKGFYRGSRFCWGGVLGDVEIGGFKLFHAWKDKHDPTNNDDIIGPVLEFGQDSPLGYAEAKVGEPFVKIGVGELTKPKEEKYSFFTNYKVADAGLWKVKRYDKKVDSFDWVEFRQTLLSKTGYGYHFAVNVHIADRNSPSCLQVTYELINIGRKKINTNVYNHNFFNVNNQPIGPKYHIEFYRTVEPTADSTFGDRARFVNGPGEHGRIEFPMTLRKEAAFGRIRHDENPGTDLFKMIYRESEKNWVKVLTWDTWSDGRKRSKFQLWAITTVMCPEPFYDIALEPGESLRWETQYDFELSSEK